MPSWGILQRILCAHMSYAIVHIFKPWDAKPERHKSHRITARPVSTCSFMQHSKLHDHDTLSY